MKNRITGLAIHSMQEKKSNTKASDAVEKHCSSYSRQAEHNSLDEQIHCHKPQRKYEGCEKQYGYLKMSNNNCQGSTS